MTAYDMPIHVHERNEFSAGPAEHIYVDLSDVINILLSPGANPRVIAHDWAHLLTTSLQREQEEWNDSLMMCPDCGNKSVRGKMSGVECTTPGCGYWYCA